MAPKIEARLLQALNVQAAIEYSKSAPDRIFRRAARDTGRAGHERGFI